MSDRKSTYLAACALVAAALVTISPGAAEAGAAYRIFSASSEGESEALYSRTVRAGDRRLSHEAGVAWDSLAKELFWPFGRADALISSGKAESLLIFRGRGLPQVPVSLSVQRLRGGPSCAGGCAAARIGVSGLFDETQGGDESSRGSGIGAVEISGEGIAMLCPGEALPSALSLRISRRVVPSLWRMHRPGESSISFVETAWAKAP